jgi:hypothetical protein
VGMGIGRHAATISRGLGCVAEAAFWNVGAFLSHTSSGMSGKGRFEPLGSGRGRSMISTGREWLHRVVSGPSPRRIKVAGLRRMEAIR